MPDYSKGKIYMVCSNDGNNDVVYYGSTCNKLSVRMAGHRSDYNHKYKQCSSYKVFDKYGLNNCHIELICLFSCKSKDELTHAEHEYIRNNICANRQGKGRDKDASKRAQVKFANSHREEINKNNRDKYLQNIDKERERSKKYADSHKEEIKTKGELYRSNNKDMINEKTKARRVERIICECGRDICKARLREHCKSAFHQAYLNLTI